jgi:hypothetical protein
MPFHLEEDEIEDAEYTELPSQMQPEPQLDYAVSQPDFSARDVVRLNVDTGANPSLEPALYERRARAVTLFVKVPLLTFVALSEKTPTLIRLGAGLLALWEASQIYRGAGEIEATTREWVGQ